MLCYPFLENVLRHLKDDREASLYKLIIKFKEVRP